MSGRSSVVESLLPKQVVVGSSPIARSNTFNRWGLVAIPFILVVSVPITVGFKLFLTSLKSGSVCVVRE